MVTSWTQFIPLLAEGAKVTIAIAFISSAVAMAVSLLIGLCRLSRFRAVRAVSAVYVEFFRGSSLLIQLFWIYFALPFIGIELPKFAAAVVAFGLNYGAYGSEIVRSSIQAIPKGQWEACTALNMKPWQTMKTIILPQAFLRMLPPFGNLLVELIKGTSLVYFITLADLTYQAMVLRNNYISWSPVIMVLLLLMYFAIASLVSFGVRLAERKMAAGRM
ncbi:ectoine/hydroxyectoine ABC transporter permease subunit EhuC [Paenibacillus doosanensis]|uniref:ectoine/hydroxyectoine ABC transporter permease subunit EhuC n=1 Tax=Paenibacillus doosanensis TaxID=1229154 RepID=UPI00217F5511|nr:ectoine/hydroxyectoine ABC transporter permease subunit EhuC [Paenibacillus doosanensis]MCS7461713.1 ectoine/hydroxyectoine ABC transporter permease subunit EhuC [Paenibacillus doosanensis]